MSAGLRYQATSFGTAPQEAKSGSYVYHGTATGFHEWEFRTKIRVELAKSNIKKLLEQEAQNLHPWACTCWSRRDARQKTRESKSLSDSLCAGASEQDPADGAEGGNPDEEEEEAAASGGEVGWSAPASPQPPLSPPGSVHTVTNAVKVEQLAGEIESMRAELVQKVLEGLRGDAYLVAQDLGVSKLMEDDGIDQFIMALRKMMIFPSKLLKPKNCFVWPAGCWTVSKANRWKCHVVYLKTSTLVAPSPGIGQFYGHQWWDESWIADRGSWPIKARAAHGPYSCQDTFLWCLCCCVVGDSPEGL